MNFNYNVVVPFIIIVISSLVNSIYNKAMINFVFYIAYIFIVFISYRVSLIKITREEMNLQILKFLKHIYMLVN